jgi:hypothetical protein
VVGFFNTRWRSIIMPEEVAKALDAAKASLRAALEDSNKAEPSARCGILLAGIIGAAITLMDVIPKDLDS